MDFRIVKPGDVASLLAYFEGLSSETKNFFAPHSFDVNTVESVCHGKLDTTSFVGMYDGHIVGYAVIKPGYSEGELYRYPGYPIEMTPDRDFIFAPSLADEYQSKGWGTGLLHFVEDHLRMIGAGKIALWGGVQKRNARAVRFYQKNGFIVLGEFHHEGIDNFDMVKHLEPHQME